MTCMRSTFNSFILISSLALSCCLPSTAAEIPLPEVRAIAKEAYTFAFPLVDSYRIEYAYFVDQQNPEYKAPWNTIFNNARVFTPNDKAMTAPNSDTPYSQLGLDLRVEPIVLTVPVLEERRYFSVELIDLYTFVFGYIGSRTTGNKGGSFLIAGPSWQGDKPAGITSVIRCETDFALALYRTQLFDPKDIENVKKIQSAYKVQTLSEFTGKPKLAAKPVDFIKPLSHAAQKHDLEFFNILNFILQYCPTHPTEKALMDRFAKIGIGAGVVFDKNSLDPAVKQAITEGVADAWAAQQQIQAEIDAKKITSGECFGSRELLKDNYRYRMAGAVLGIWANAKEEAMYPMYMVDAAGKPLTGIHNYTLHFAADKMPPVHSFWSLTMYSAPEGWLVDNPLNRYLINSPMAPNFKRDADGGLTLYVQHQTPGPDKEANWLPAPAGPFFMAMRVYWPKKELLDGTWIEPALQRMPK